MHQPPPRGGSEIVQQEDSSSKKVILKLAWPVIIEQALNTLTQVVDMMMVGRLGAAAVTAVGLSIQPLLFSLAIGISISVGTTALVARFIGAGDEEEAGRTLQQSLLSVGVLTIIVSIIFFLLAEQVIRFMGAEAEVIPLGTTYIRILVPGLMFMFIGFVLTSALRGAGDTKTPMKVNLVLNIINVFGNYVLIFGRLGFPEMGLQGAALATTFARSLTGIVLFIHVFKPQAAVTLLKKNFFIPDLQRIKRILNIGYPAALEQLVMRTAQILFVRVVAGLGTVAFAAHQIAINVESISYMPGIGIATAATTLVGQNLGAERPKQAERSGHQAWQLGALIMGGMALLFFFIPDLLMRLYTDDPAIISQGALALRIVAFAQIPMGTQFIYAGGLRGAGETRSVFYSTAISSWIGRLGMAYIFIEFMDMGLAGAWLAMVIDWSMRGGYVFYRFKLGRWKELEV